MRMTTPPAGSTIRSSTVSGVCSMKLALTGNKTSGRCSCRSGRRIHANHSVMMPANEPAVYCIRDVGATYPQSHVTARVRPPRRARCQSQLAAASASTASATCNIPSDDRATGVSAPTQTGFQTSTARNTAGQKTTGARPIATHAAPSTSIAPRIAGPLSCACAAAWERGAPKNTTPQTFTKHASASAPVTPRRIDAGLRPRAEREERRRPRHHPPQPAELAHFARAGSVQYRAGGEEQQGFEQPVIPHMQKPASQRQPTPCCVTLTHRHERETKPDKNDADVFNTVISEQAFEVVLTERESDAEHGASHTEERHHPPGLWRHGQPAAESHEPVNGNLKGHAREHGGDMARRVGVRCR